MMTRNLLNKRRSMGGRARPRRTNTKGAAQIEFLLTIITIIMTMLLMWEVIMAVYTMNVLSDAAKEGVRYAITHGSKGGTDTRVLSGCPYTDSISCTVWYYARYSLHDVSGMTVSVNIYKAGACATTGGTFPEPAGSCVQVRVTYPYVPFAGVPIKPTLSAVSQGRMIN
jgi:hypothetical protein